jgi:hypothetical protein
MVSPEPPPEPTIPRVLLFGHRGAGKSALIGALLQAGETQGETLRGEVVHSSVDLPRIRDAVYNGAKIEPHQRELVSYTIRMRPWRVGTKPMGEPMSVILDDCDGKAAESLLEHPEPITQQAPDSPIAKAVTGANAIMLLVDAAASDDELKEAFKEFEQFLDVVWQAKTDAREVGGFPVFLVLTQCDRLARPGDTLAMWESRVKERSEQAWKAFDEFLKDATPEEGEPSLFLPFGSVDLNVMSVAVRQPPVGGMAAALMNQPYGVAELFRDCFSEAKAHRERVRSSDRRLKWTVRFALAAFTVLVCSLTTIALFPPHRTGPTLAEKVQAYANHEPRAAVRLANGEIERNKHALLGFTSDTDYPELEADLRAFVESRLKEIEDYEAYCRKLAKALAPGATRSLPDLAKVHNTLDKELALPLQYGWEETAAAQLRAKWLADCDAIKAAEEVLVGKYREFESNGTTLMLTRTFDAQWLANIDALIAKAAPPPFPLNDPIPKSPTINQPRGDAVTWRVPYEFDEVFHTRRYWEQTRDKLIHLRDLADALGMTTAPNRPAPVLMLPEPNGSDSNTLPSERWMALFPDPRQSTNYSKWELQHFPDPARTELTKKVKASFDTGVRHVHKFLNVKDTKEGWKDMATQLSQPALREWGRLLHLLARLQDPTAPDPVTELETFLRDLDTKAFELDLLGFELTLPLDFTVGLDRVEPVGPLTITVTKGQSQEPRGVLKFNVGKRDTRGKVNVYSLSREGNGKDKRNYFAGDDFRAELPVKAGTQEFKLIWDKGSSDTFRFDRLSREPRLAKPTGTSEPAVGVKLVPSATSVIPKFPVLMPVK